MDNDTPRYGSRNDDDGRRYSDDPKPAAERDDRPSFMDRSTYDDGTGTPGDAASGDPPAARPGGLEGLRPSRFDDDDDGARSRETYSSAPIRDNGSSRADRSHETERYKPGTAPASPFASSDGTNNPLLKPETSTRRFSWEDTEPAKPASRPNTPVRDYEPPRYEPRQPRLDNIAEPNPEPPQPNYGSERYADTGYRAPPPPAQDYGRRPEPAYQPPEPPRGYDDTRYDAGEYVDPRQGYEPYEAAAYQGAHSRELADVDQDYAREYQYAAEPLDPRQGYPEYDQDYPQYEQPYGEYPPQKKRRGPFLLLGSLIGVAVIAGGLIFAYQELNGTSEPTVPTVAIDENPTKIEPETQTTSKEAPPQRTKLIYDRIRGEETETDNTLIPREEQPATPSNQTDLGLTPGSDDVAATPTGQTETTTSDDVTGSDPLPLPLPPPPVNSNQNTQTVQPTFNTTTQNLNTGGDVVVPSGIEPPAPATQETAAATTTETATSQDAITKLLQSPPLPQEKPTPPSREAAPGPAVPTGPIQIAPLPGSVERDTAVAEQNTTDQSQPTPLLPAQPSTQPQQTATTETTRTRSSRFSEDETTRSTSSTQSDTQVAALPTETPAPTVQPQPAPITGGRYVVQLGTFPSQAEAQTKFQKLQTKDPNLLDTYSSLIQESNLGATGTFYRLRVGPIEQRSSASQLCNSLIASGERDCFVRTR